MNLLLGPALRLVFSSADLWSLNIAVFHKGSSANLDSLVESDGFVLDETVLPVVLLALLLLLGLVVGDVGGVAPPVIGVVALHNIIVLGLLDHLHLVDTSLTISPGTSGSDSTEANISVVTSLSLTTTSKSLRGISFMVVMVVIMMSMMMIISIGVEWKGSYKRFSIPVHLSPQLTGTKDA